MQACLSPVVTTKTKSETPEQHSEQGPFFATEAMLEMHQEQVTLQEVHHPTLVFCV